MKEHPPMPRTHHHPLNPRPQRAPRPWIRERLHRMVRKYQRLRRPPPLPLEVEHLIAEWHQSLRQHRMQREPVQLTLPPP